MRPLEADLWLAPLRAGMAEALATLGVVSRRRLRRSPLVSSVAGWAVCDLEIIGLAEHPSRWRSLAPAPAFRHLRSAWRVGSLRAALTATAREVASRVDDELDAVPGLTSLTARQLGALLTSVVAHQQAVHAHQMLTAILEPDSGTTVAGLAAAALRRERALGGTDAEIIAREPLVLGLVPPRLGGLALPSTLAAEPAGPEEGIGALGSRELLRFRVRCLQELAARAASELGRRWGLPAERLALLGLAELCAMADGAPPPPDLAERIDTTDPPVPAAFRVDADGVPVPQRLHARSRLGGRGASRGNATGLVAGVDGDVPDGAILVVHGLEPRLAPLLPRIAGVISETGGVLSHLAILAREQRVPAVVGVEDACQRFPAGVIVTMDGGTGEVRRLP
jgi:pyruvate,water dikinase